MSAPLRELTKKDKQFYWAEQQEQSFLQIKELLTSAKVIAYFDPSTETDLITDASPTGLSAILVQKTPDLDDRRVVAYASRTLSPVERRYSQTEKETLAIVWAVGKLHMGHSMSNQHKKILTLTDLNETWFLHSVCSDINLQ